MNRAKKPAPAPMIPHWAWDAPRIVTHDTHDCTMPECSRDEWTGENVYSGGLARCAPLPHWDAIVAESERVGWPTRFRRDLYVHDRAGFAFHDAAEPFLWILRESGTHFFPVSERDGKGHGAEHFAMSIPRIFDSEGFRIYTWDGSRLTKHKTPESAAEVMREHRARFERDNATCASCDAKGGRHAFYCRNNV